jgi:hypothetical protein
MSHNSEMCIVVGVNNTSSETIATSHDLFYSALYVMDMVDVDVLEGLPRGCATNPTTVISLRLNAQCHCNDSEPIPTRLRPLMLVSVD